MATCKDCGNPDCPNVHDNATWNRCPASKWFGLPSLDAEDAIERSRTTKRVVLLNHDDLTKSKLEQAASLIYYQDDRLGPYDIYQGQGWRIHMHAGRES